jgi:hypothetical protein
MKIIRVSVFILAILLILSLSSGIIYMNLTPGRFQNDGCGCSVRYTTTDVMDPNFVTLNDQGILECKQTPCPFNFLNQLKLMAAYVDFKK